VIQWLLQVKPTIDISADNEYAFRSACTGGHLNVAQWLLQVKPTIDISAFNERAFGSAFAFGYLNVAQWYEIINEDSPDWSCRILTDPKDIKWNKNKKLVGLASQKGNIVEKMPTDLVRITGSYL